MNDVVLLAHLLGVTVDRMNDDGNVAGSVLENFALMELRKQAEDRTGKVVGVEPKAASTVASNDVGGWQGSPSALGKNLERRFALYTGADAIPFAANLHGVPISRLWSAL